MKTYIQLLTASLLIFILCKGRIYAQIDLVNPVPHTVHSHNSDLLAAPHEWRINSSKNLPVFVEEALERCVITKNPQATFTLTLGVKGDAAIKKYTKFIPKVSEGYYLNITSEGAIVAGFDERGVYYGIQTLLQSLAQGKLELCSVTDWPDVPFRGTVEGFYGTPWSHQARLSQIAFYGRNKMNVYIYGPKDDPFHRDHWRDPYPTLEAKRILELNEQSQLHGVRFYWAIHPGVDIKWTTEDRDALVKKFEQMYDLGIRSFAVFFDDIWGEGAKADKQAELLNYIDNHFVRSKHDVSPLLLCPTEYNRAWANDKTGYLNTLGNRLNKNIQIMWTGNSVVHCIDKESMEWINSRIKRKAYIWWNFPVSDFVRDHILLGPAYGNDLNIANDMSGFVSNPMEHAEASKIALYGIADYTWNMKAYDPQRDWVKAIKDLLPDNAQALRTFALYNKDLGPNGHRFRREEGKELEATAESALRGDRESIEKLFEDNIALKMAVDVLLTDKTNPELIRELRPWLLQARNLADYGQSVCYMAIASKVPSKSFPAFTDLYAQARSLREQMFELENSNVRHALQPGIKVGTRVMLPTLNRLFSQSVDRYNKECGTALDTTATYQPFRMKSDVSQLSGLPLAITGNELSVSPSNEVINWQQEGHITIETEHDVNLANLTLDLGTNDAPSHFKIEVLSDNKWIIIPLIYTNEGRTLLKSGKELNGLRTSCIRLTNVSGKDLQVYFKQFKINWQ